MLGNRFWSFIAGLSVLCLTATACSPPTANSTAANQPAANQALIKQSVANHPGNSDPNLTASETTLPADAEPLRNPGKIVSGEYGALLLGVGTGGELTGNYSNSRGDGQFSCVFYIRGKLRNGVAEIATWFPKDKEIIRGRLKFVEDDGKPGVNIKLRELPGGCGMVAAEFDDENGSTHLLNELGEWQTVRVVSAAKAFFHNSPNSAARQKAFVIEYDAVRVFKTRNGWIEAEFGNECVDDDCRQRKTTRGWIKQADLFSPKPPK